MRELGKGEHNEVQATTKRAVARVAMPTDWQ